nr:hypothetical protein [Tanacetum cinerariifolium]
MRVATQESQGGMRFKDNDLKIKIQAYRRANNESKEFPRTQGSKFQEGQKLSYISEEVPCLAPKVMGSLSRGIRSHGEANSVSFFVQGIKQVHLTEEEDPLPINVYRQTEEEDPLLLDIVYPLPEIASSSRDINIRGQAHYGLRSLGPIQEEVVVVKKPYSLVKVTNAVLGLRA